VKDMLYAVLALIAAGVAAWQIWSYLAQKATKGVEVSHNPMYIGIVCAILAIIFGALFLSGRVNREEEIHITE